MIFGFGLKIESNNHCWNVMWCDKGMCGGGGWLKSYLQSRSVLFTRCYYKNSCKNWQIGQNVTIYLQAEKCCILNFRMNIFHLETAMCWSKLVRSSFVVKIKLINNNHYLPTCKFHVDWALVKAFVTRKIHTDIYTNERSVDR